MPFTLQRVEHETLREFKRILCDLSYSTLHITSEFGSQAHWLRRENKTSTTASKWNNSLTSGENIKADSVAMWKGNSNSIGNRKIGSDLSEEADMWIWHAAKVDL